MSLAEVLGARWDFVVVGGGSAGCVMAEALSRDPSRRVLLLEAGRDVPPGQEPTEILDMYPGVAAFDPANHWPDIAANFSPVGHNAPPRPPQRRYEQARLLGGGSSINGQVANRGTPDDYEEWRGLGAEGWGWDDVLPFFRAIERDLDFSGPLHGASGPIPIHRVARPLWPGFSTAVADALHALGHADIGDQNGVFGDGWFAQSLSNDGRHRVSAAMAFLGASTRARPNLHVLAGAEASRLAFEGRRACGVEVVHGRAAGLVRAAEVVLCAGAIHSPALLLRSGIGPGGDLRALGIEVRLDREGVGRNLQEHPGISISAFIKPWARLAGTTRRHNHLALRFSSGLPGSPASDLYMMAIAKSGWHPVGRRTGTLVAWLNKVHSRGRVVLRSPDPATGPLANFDFLADPRDARRLVDAFRFLARLARTEPLARCIEGPSPSTYSGVARALGTRSLRNILATAPAALLLDMLPPLRRLAMERIVSGGVSLDALVADEEALEAHVRARVFGQWHPCGTCRMGPGSDRGAVVDPLQARLHGVDGLRVVDASVMPTAPRANLNLPTMMLAAKFGDAITRASAAGGARPT